MRRAHEERRTTHGQWRNRHPLDSQLAPGYFRKGRRARGCPRYCVHCRLLKFVPTRQELRAGLAFSEWMIDACIRPQP